MLLEPLQANSISIQHATNLSDPILDIHGYPGELPAAPLGRPTFAPVSTSATSLGQAARSPHRHMS